MQVAILAGGLATRLGGLTKDQPKSLVRVSGKPFLEYQLEFLRRGGIEDVVLCTGHLGEQIESYFGDGAKFGVKIEYSRERKLLGTGGALKNAEALLQEEFFTLYGDSYLFLDPGVIMSYFKSHDSPALMTVYKNCDQYDRSNTAIAGNRVKAFSKREKTPDMLYIEYGMNILRKRALDAIPEDAPFGLDELFQRLAKMGEILAFEVKERFYEIGSPQGLRDFEYFVRETAAQSRIPQHYHICHT